MTDAFGIKMKELASRAKVLAPIARLRSAKGRQAERTIHALAAQARILMEAHIMLLKLSEDFSDRRSYSRKA